MSRIPTRYELEKSGMHKMMGKFDGRYDNYSRCANDGKGGDITNNGKPLKTYDEWLNS